MTHTIYADIDPPGHYFNPYVTWWNMYTGQAWIMTSTTTKEGSHREWKISDYHKMAGIMGIVNESVRTVDEMFSEVYGRNAWDRDRDRIAHL
jgi:hypothetical protein